MKLHEWKESFETGNAVIDAQHRRLVESLNNILTLCGEGKGDEAFAKCMAFRQLTREHFNEEVGILSEAEFPRLEAHLGEQKNFLRKVEEVFSNCGMTCKGSSSFYPCVENLWFMTVDHLLRYDLDFKSHLQAVNMADSGA